MATASKTVGEPIHQRTVEAQGRGRAFQASAEKDGEMAEAEAGKAPPAGAPADAAPEPVALCAALSRHGGRRAVLPGAGGGDDAGAAARRAPHDRPRLFQLRSHLHRQLFLDAGGDRRRARAGVGLPLLLRHHARRARRRRYAQRGVRACDAAVAGLLRYARSRARSCRGSPPTRRRSNPPSAPPLRWRCATSSWGLAPSR